MSEKKETVIFDNFKTIDITFMADTVDFNEAIEIAKSFLKEPDKWDIYGASQNEIGQFEITLFQGVIRDEAC